MAPGFNERVTVEAVEKTLKIQPASRTDEDVALISKFFTSHSFFKAFEAPTPGAPPA
jgi:hypothetical protein